MEDLKDAGKFLYLVVWNKLTNVIFFLKNSVVEYRHPEDAKRAIHIMNKAEFMGRPVFVREVKIYISVRY